MSHWPKAAVPRSPDGKNNEKLTVIVKISRERSVYMDILVRNNTCAGLYAARFHGPHCHVIGRAGPGRDVRKNDCPDRAGQ